MKQYFIDGDADLEEVNDVMAVASLLKMFLVCIVHKPCYECIYRLSLICKASSLHITLVRP